MNYELLILKFVITLTRNSKLVTQKLVTRNSKTRNSKLRLWQNLKVA